MKCQILFSWKSNKNIISLLSAEYAQSMVMLTSVCYIILSTFIMNKPSLAYEFYISNLTKVKYSSLTVFSAHIISLSS